MAKKPVSFNTAFASARKAGKKVFSWNGQSYNTKLKSDSKPSAKNAPVPKARPGTKDTAKNVPVPKDKPKGATSNPLSIGAAKAATVPVPTPAPKERPAERDAARIRRLFPQKPTQAKLKAK